MTCHTANTAAKAVSMMQGFRYKLILIDYILDEGYGDQLFITARQIYQDKKPVLMFLSAFPHAEEIGTALGADYVFQKPFQLDKLQQTIESLDICRGAKNSAKNI
jgi:DNA-binding response OmpR family regulator